MENISNILLWMSTICLIAGIITMGIFLKKRTISWFVITILLLTTAFSCFISAQLHSEVVKNYHKNQQLIKINYENHQVKI